MQLFVFSACVDAADDSEASTTSSHTSLERHSADEVRTSSSQSAHSTPAAAETEHSGLNSPTTRYATHSVGHLANSYDEEQQQLETRTGIQNTSVSVIRPSVEGIATYLSRYNNANASRDLLIHILNISDPDLLICTASMTAHLVLITLLLM